MVSVVSSSPTGGNFIFLRHLDAYLYKNDRNVRFVLFTKTSIVFVQEIMDKSDCRKDVAAEEMAAILGDNKEALILDLGAGTGIVGKYVRFILLRNIYLCKYFSISS